MRTAPGGSSASVARELCWLCRTHYARCQMAMEPPAPIEDGVAARTTGELAPAAGLKLTLSLLDNAYGSLNDSLEQAEMADPAGEHRRWKLAIFLLVHALELMLKERLRREHRLLVYSNVDKPRHTVSMEVALERLQAIGVGIDTTDDRAIRKAIDWRDRIAHYEIELNLEDAKRAFAALFEFAHTFHRVELTGDLHHHIAEDNWTKEAELMEVFRSEFVTYNGAQVARDWPGQMLAAQDTHELEVEGKTYHRINYGSEKAPWGASTAPCHDCAVVDGQFHVPGCDMEQCPRCEEQIISCPCPFVGWDDRDDPDPDGDAVRGR